MNYLNLIKCLVAEATEMKQYKNLKAPYSVFAFIGLSPIILFSVFSILMFVAMSFLYEGVASGVHFLEKWIEEKRKDLHPATEAVLYFCTIPTVFFMNVLLSSFALTFYLSWFSVQVYTFYATLGGIRWQPSIMDATYDDVAELEIKTNKTTGRGWSIAFFILAIAIILSTISGIYLVRFVPFIALVYWISILVAIPSVFKKGPVEVANEEAAPEVEQPVEETV